MFSGWAKSINDFSFTGFFVFMMTVLIWGCVCVAVLFLEHWKRRQISLSFSWDLTGIEEDEVNTSSAQRARSWVMCRQTLMLFFFRGYNEASAVSDESRSFLFLDVFLTRQIVRFVFCCDSINGGDSWVEGAISVVNLHLTIYTSALPSGTPPTQIRDHPAPKETEEAEN